MDHNSAIANNCRLKISIASSLSGGDHAQAIGIATILYSPRLKLVEGTVRPGEADAHDVAISLHTSKMKGVMLNFGNLDVIISAAKYCFESDDSRVLQQSSWAHENALFQMLIAIITGGTLILN